MGEVSLWRDERIGRDLAVKVALGSLGDEGRRRFVREALLQSRLEHPAFVPVYDVATDERGEIYFTMRRIKGRTLRATAKDEGVSKHRLLASFVQLCLAVDYAHSRGVVHRDIKPDNVMLGDFGEVYLLDWGVAKIAEELEGDLAPLDLEANAGATRDGAVLGTIGYMPPEQLRGGHATLDARADVYALGAVLFEILAGEPLHRGAALSDLIASMLDGTTDARPSARGADVAPELDEICRRATAQDREERFESARALGDAVERYLEGDRDAALRRARAEEHSQRAAELLESAGDDLDRRVQAGREAVRAIVYDPEHPGARSMLAKTLGDPIGRAPAAAVEEVDVEQDRQSVAWLRTSLFGLVAGELAIIPLLLWCGIREASSVALWAVTTLAAVVGTLIAARASRQRRQLWVWIAGALLCVSYGFLARWLSPLLVLPMLAIETLLLATPIIHPRGRWLALVCTTGMVLAPLALETLGVVSPTFSMSEDGMTVTGRMAGMPPVWLLAAHFVMVVWAAQRIMFPFVDRARVVDVSARSQTWLLRRVLESS